MASIKTRKVKAAAGKGRKTENRYDVRYRTPAGQVRTRTFRNQDEARKFANTVEADKARGDWLDPEAGKLTFAEWSDRWLKTCSHLRPATRVGYQRTLKNYLLPTLAETPVAKIDHASVLELLSSLTASGKAPWTVRQARHVLRAVLALAVKADAIRSNPVEGAKVPRAKRGEMHFLTPAQVLDLAAAIESPPVKTGGGEHRRDTFPEYSLLVRLTAYTGMRASEVCGLRVRRLDLLRRRLNIAETLSEVAGELHEGPTKTYETRTVPIPSGLADELAEHIAGMGPDDYVFRSTQRTKKHPNGGPLRWRNFYARHYKPAVIAAGLPEAVRFHDLRHTYAALMVAQNAPALAVSRRMGHSSIAVTFDVYGHLFPEVDQSLDAAMDEVYATAEPTPVAEVEPMARAMHARWTGTDG